MKSQGESKVPEKALKSLVRLRMAAGVYCRSAVHGSIVRQPTLDGISRGMVNNLLSTRWGFS